MKKIVYSLALLFLFSCKSNTIYDEPKDLISRDSMILLIKDMYIATSARHVKNKFSQKRKNYMPLVFEKYHIDSLRFETSNNFYTSNVETYNEMIFDVKKKLQDELAVYQNEIKAQDSIKEVERKNDSIASFKLKKTKDSLFLTEKIVEIEILKDTIKKKAKDSLKLKKKIKKLKKSKDSIESIVNENIFLENKTIEIKQIKDSIKNYPKDSILFVEKIVALRALIDSIEEKPEKSKTLKRKKDRLKKGTASTKKKVKTSKIDDDYNNQRE